MKKFEILKTIQLILFIILTATALVTVFRDDELYQTIAAGYHTGCADNRRQYARRYGEHTVRQHREYT